MVKYVWSYGFYFFGHPVSFYCVSPCELTINPGKYLFRGKVMVPNVKLSTSYGIDRLRIVKNIFHFEAMTILQLTEKFKSGIPLPPVKRFSGTTKRGE